MKKPILILLFSSIIITSGVGIGTYFITHHIEKTVAKEEKEKLVLQAFEAHYNDRIALFKEENKHLSNVDISFIGDSLTEGYDVKSFYPEYNVVNRGISGDTTFGVEKRLDSSAYDVNPKVISLLIGANNFDTMLDNYESIISKIKSNLPSTKVILCSLTSMTGNWAKNNEKAKQNNEKIKEISVKYNYNYVDLYNALLDQNTNQLKEEYSLDGGHLKEAGYIVVTNKLKEIIKTLI